MARFAAQTVSSELNLQFESNDSPNEKKFRNGPRTADSGCTHASVSDIIIDEDATCCTASKDATWLFMLTTSVTSIGASCRWDGNDDVVVVVTRSASRGANPMHEVIDDKIRRRGAFIVKTGSYARSVIACCLVASSSAHLLSPYVAYGLRIEV